MRVALVQSEAGGAAGDRRARVLARVLQARGHEVTLVVPQTELRVSLPGNAAEWLAEGFACIPVGAGHMPPGQGLFPRDASMVTMHAVAGVVRVFDVVWFFEAEWALATLRERRFSVKHGPLVVIDRAQGKDPIPDCLAQINHAFAREYAARWADLTLESEGYEADAVKVEDARREQVARPMPVPGVAKTSPAVTVCVPYFEAHAHVEETLRSLETQTCTDFTVILVDDGSHSAEALLVFERCRARYAQRGWRFVQQTNQSSGAARNRAAQEASSEFVLFVDSDDIPMPGMVESFLRGALLTGDECLVARNYGFVDDPDGPCVSMYDPPGNSLIGSMGDDMHGGACIFIRREAFLAMGGFTTIRGVGFEDYEFHIRANLAGMRWDILPDLVYRYRMPRAGGVSQSTKAYPNLARVLRWYEERLRPCGLEALPLAFASTYWKLEEQTERVRALERTLSHGVAKRGAQGREIKLLLLACNFPYGMVSGWHTRMQQTIRYFGSRYQVTLVTSMPREQLAPLKKVAFEHLHAVIGIEGSDKTAITDPETPFRIREHYTDTYTAALRGLPTNHFHAALLDQIFLAEFRKDLDTLPVLMEQNIESKLLWQASQRDWDGDLPKHYQNARIEAQRLERYEDKAWPEFPLRVEVSEVDRLEVDRRAQRGRTVVAPNGADPSLWLEDARFSSRSVLFAGHLAYLPNVDGVGFLLGEIWPAVRRRMPDAHLLIAGRAPSDAVLEVVARAGGQSAGVELIASPESMTKVARRASMSICPLRLGSGTRLKILESMAWGLPVVSTTLGAEGIDVADGEHVLLRDDPEEFAEAIVQLLSDEALWQRLRMASGELIRERYSWDRVFDPFNEALMELIS